MVAKAKTNRPRGRPRSFDEAEAVRKATDVFWAKGFEAATIDDLVAAMGVQRPTLYAVFGDKSALFVRCLDAYLTRYGKPIMEAFLAPKDVRDALRVLLRVSIENATGPKSPSGCLFVNVAPMVDDANIRSYLKNFDSEMTVGVAKRLQQGIESGQLPQDFPCESRARITMSMSRGSVLRARLGAARRELLTDVDEQVSLILSH